jgi:hypothetical protein
VCHSHHLRKIESVFFRPLPPVSLDEGCRIDEDAVVIKYDGIALELLYMCDLSGSWLSVLGFAR